MNGERYYEPGHSKINVAREEAYDEGYEAFFEYRKKSDCPYTDDSRLAMDWHDGWDTARMAVEDSL